MTYTDTLILIIVVVIVVVVVINMGRPINDLLTLPVTYSIDLSQLSESGE